MILTFILLSLESRDQIQIDAIETENGKGLQ